MRQQHHPHDIKTYEKGINSDTNKELLGMSDGEYVDALNMRSLPMDGDNSAVKKVKGEKRKYKNLDNRCIGATDAPLDSAYECMLALEVNNHIIEVHAHPEPELNPPLMRINGKIVLMSSDFPIDVQHPLQYDKNETCVGGEIYITNNRTPPMVFSVKDLMNNSGLSFMGETDGLECTTKYFDEFNIDQYTVRISSNFNKMFFIQQDSSTTLFPYTNTFGSLGLPVGYYSYSYRFATSEGDVTNWSPVTELIPVVDNVASPDNIFPARRSYSSESNVTSTSGYGNHLRVRIENFNEFESIQIRRDGWYAGDSLGNPPTSVIIGFATIIEGVSVLDILDRAADNEVEETITIQEQSDSMSAIERAKSVRYYNSKLYLMNIGYASKDIDDVIEFTSSTDAVFPTIENMGKLAHKNPYYATHYKSNMRGDRAGYAVVLYDKDGNMSYAKKIDGAENFEFPNRRDVASDLTLGTSYGGVVKSANVNGTVTYTNEVFDHKNASSKSGQMKANILEDGFIGNQNIPWNPMAPTSQTDNSSSHGFVVNSKVKYDFDDWRNYNPECFGLNYYSMGVAFKGLNLPNWATGFSVVQTESVKRVVAQGLGWYKMEQAEGLFGKRGTKSANDFWLYIPDFDEETGIYTSLADDFINNWQNYKVQLVAPLGFFSEVYSFFQDLSPYRDMGADIITYCRVINDNGNINPTGIEGISSAGINYVGYGANVNNNPPAVFPSNGDGNHIFELNKAPQLNQTATGLCKYFQIQTTESFYADETTQGVSYLEFAKEEVQDFLEPMYVVNIIREEAQVLDLNTTQYKYTGHFVKKESLIGISDGTEFTAQVVSERWEDCIPRLNIHTSSFNDYSELNRFTFVEDSLGNRRRWLNVSYKTDAQIDAILSELSVSGFYNATDSSGSYLIYGVYKHTELYVGQHREVRLVYEQFSNAYDVSFMVPSAGSSVYIDYDNRIPVRVFGGDTWINESIWAPIDNQYNKQGNPISSSHDFFWDIPMPFGGYRIEADDIIIVRNTKGVDRTQDSNQFEFKEIDRPANIRQWVVMWTAETRTNLSFCYNDESTKHNFDQTFPLKNYVMRPYRWDDSTFADASDEASIVEVYEDNNLHAQSYYDAYGSEYLLWGYGGFRFRPRTNIDYSKNQNTQLITTTPKIGFEEQTDFCTRVLWSELRPINSQFSPTVRTFPAGNFYDLPDNTGEIKFAWSSLSSDKGNNLYAITNDGVALLLIDKRIIHEINASELATVGSDIGGILNHIWIETSVGMKDQTWRSWAEYSNALFFHNGSSAYMLIDNQLSNLTENGWNEMYKNRVAPYIGSGYSTKLSGVFNVLNKEYIMNLDKSSVPLGDDKYNVIPQSLIYGVPQEHLQCRSTYNYDKYLSFSNKLYGFKGLDTFELGIGNVIDGEEMECFISSVSDKEIYYDKEFIRIRINSNSKPKFIYFFDSYEDYLTDNYSSVVDATSSAVAIKNYFGYECYIPRKSFTPHDRQQGRVVIFKIVSSSDENFVISNTGVQYKVLK